MHDTIGKVTHAVGRTLKPVFSPLGKVLTPSDASTELLYHPRSLQHHHLGCLCSPCFGETGLGIRLRGVFSCYLDYGIPGTVLCRSFERRNIGGGLFSLAVLQGIGAGGRDGERRFNHSGGNGLPAAAAVTPGNV